MNPDQATQGPEEPLKPTLGVPSAQHRLGSFHSSKLCFLVRAFNGPLKP